MIRDRAGLGETKGPEDFVLVNFERQKISGQGGRHTELRC